MMERFNSDPIELNFQLLENYDKESMNKQHITHLKKNICGDQSKPMVHSFGAMNMEKKTLVSFRFQQGARLLIHSIPKAMMAYHVLMTKCKQSLKHGAWWLPGWVLGILGDPI